MMKLIPARSGRRRTRTNQWSLPIVLAMGFASASSRATVHSSPGFDAGECFESVWPPTLALRSSNIEEVKDVIVKSTHNFHH